MLMTIVEETGKYMTVSKEINIKSVRLPVKLIMLHALKLLHLFNGPVPPLPGWWTM